MNIADYPEQEPLNENGLGYKATTLRLSAGIEGKEIQLGDHPCQGLLLFESENACGDVLLFMHGGGWTNGYKEMMAFMAPALTALGVTFASVSYRLAPAFTFPVGWQDAALAVTWVYENIALHGGDPTRIFIGGHSAGGHYAALLAVSHAWQEAARVPRTVIQGCLPISGIYDFMPGNGMSVRPRFLGPVDANHEQPASPLHQIDGSPPPFLLAHGSNDFPHLSTQAVRMEGALRAAGGDVERIVLPLRDHFTACYSAGEADGPWVRPAVHWIRSH